MLISNTIKELQKIQEQCGNLEIVVNDKLGGYGHIDKIKKVSLIKVKSHYSGFFLKKALQDGGYGGGKAFFSPVQEQLENKPDVWVTLIN